VRVVIDANVIVQLSLAGAELGPLEGHHLIAPPIMASEVTSTLCEMTFRGEIPLDSARIAVARLGTLPITYERPDGLYERSWDLARRLGWAKSYDAEYVVLSMMTGSPLITMDDRLRRGAGHLVDMPLITELPAAR
jgi:predicted nucleic acid-binding protein